MTEQETLDQLVHFAREQFKLASGEGIKSPTGVAVLTREGMLFGGYAGNSLNPDSPSAAAKALELLSTFSRGVAREDLSPRLEIAEIVVARPLNLKKLAPFPADEATLRDLANYPGTGDGQIYYLTSGNPSDILISCKL